MVVAYDVNVLIDPSLILAKNSINNTFDLVSEFSKTGKEFKFYYPKSLHRLIEKKGLSVESPGIRFFLHNAYPSEPKELQILLKEYSTMIIGFDPAPEHKDKHGQVYENLSKELQYRGELLDKELLDILFEEWIFLQEYSWVVSRIKKPFNRFIAAGAVCMQFGRRTVDVLIRRTLRRELDDYISNADRLRAFGKWIAVGVGAQIMASINLWLSGIPGLILLFDPEPEIDGASICLHHL